MSVRKISHWSISQGYQRDEYCWRYTKNGMYTVKSEYWVARNIFNREMVEPQIESSITKLQAFAWKIQAPPKIKHFIWQTISGKLKVTSNLTHRHMRCDNHCPRCGAGWDNKSCHLWMSSCYTDMGTCGNSNSTREVPQYKPLYKHWLSFLEEERHRRPWVG